MSLFKKDGDAQVEDQSTLIASLEEQVNALTVERDALAEFKVQTEKLTELTAKSAELGFQGDVSKILVKANYDMGSAMGGLITAFGAEVSDRTETFVEQADEGDDGDAGDGLDASEPKTRDEAINLVRAQYDLIGGAAVLKANELFPNLWS